MGVELVTETSEKLHILAQLSARENFIEFCRRETFKTSVQHYLPRAVIKSTWRKMINWLGGLGMKKYWKLAINYRLFEVKFEGTSTSQHNRFTIYPLLSCMTQKEKDRSFMRDMMYDIDIRMKLMHSWYSIKNKYC